MPEEIVYSKRLLLKLSSANVLGHWSKRYALNKKLSAQVRAQCNDIKKIELPCTIILTRESPKLMDYDNYVFACKHLVDVIADMIIPGLAPGRADGDKRLKFQYEQVKRKGKQYFVCIDIKKTFANIPIDC